MSNITIGILFWFGTGVVTVLFAFVYDTISFRHVHKYYPRNWKAELRDMAKIIAVGPVGLIALIFSTFKR